MTHFRIICSYMRSVGRNVCVSPENELPRAKSVIRTAMQKHHPTSETNHIGSKIRSECNRKPRGIKFTNNVYVLIYRIYQSYFIYIVCIVWKYPSGGVSMQISLRFQFKNDRRYDVLCQESRRGVLRSVLSGVSVVFSDSSLFS